ncbi:MAG TPA: pantoate--beta-alanine ligase [Longimicrobiales bacterium]|nr:pantoate--beta-alanine ligase [Longimicrobiales bacterium]
MRTVRTRAELREALAVLRRSVRTVGLVPTMGYLHEGHLSLVDHARARAGAVVMSIFVNPLQFGPGEDLATYPRDLERDSELVSRRGVDLLFAPDLETMYPAGEPVVVVSPGPLGDRLDGAFRPGHFAGVLTVVLKLLNLIGPDVAVFGQKDYQQAALIRRMALDLDLPVEIVVAPSVRADDGLALSSRNAYLSARGREQAATLHRALRAGSDAFDTGRRDRGSIIGAAREVLERAPDVRVQYLELVDADSLEPVAVAAPGSVLAVAAFVETTRLIDNIVLG